MVIFIYKMDLIFMDMFMRHRALFGLMVLREQLFMVVS